MLKFFNYENVNICNNYRVSHIFRMGVKFSRWGKKSLGRVKIYQVATSETVIRVGSNC